MQKKLFRWNVIKKLNDLCLLARACFHHISSSFISHSFLYLAAPVRRGFFFLLAPADMTVMTASLLGLRIERVWQLALYRGQKQDMDTHVWTHTHTRAYGHTRGLRVHGRVCQTVSWSATVQEGTWEAMKINHGD